MWILSFLPDFVFHLITIAGVLGIIASFFFGFIPFVNQYKLAIQAASIAALVFGIYFEGGIANEAKWEAKVQEVKLEMAKKETASAEASVKVVTKYVETVKVVKEKGDVIIKEVPKYITKDADAKCSIPNGFVLLHDSASRNEVPISAGDANEGTSAFKLSTIAETVIANYNICYQNTEQLKALQNWIREQEAIYNK